MCKEKFIYNYDLRRHRKQPLRIIRLKWEDDIERDLSDFNWLRIGSGVGLLENRNNLLSFHKNNEFHD
jgi:hypothetical protein